MSETQKLFLDEAGLNELVDRTRTETDSKINSAINTHNSSSDSHSDIRNSLNEAKEKLDTIEDGANRYTLPKATGSTLGGVIVGNNVQVSNGTISVSEASTTEPGVVVLTDSSPVMDGVASVGSASTVARSDHKHPTDTSRAAQSELDALETEVGTLKTNLTTHTSNTSNPHGVTASQVGTYTTSEIESKLNKKANDFSIELYNGTSGNPKPVKFATVNYSTCTSENGVSAKISMVSGHGNGTSYVFLQDAIINVNYTGAVTVDNFKYYGAETSYGGVARQFGDIFWVTDTTNKLVDFYCLMGQYARVNMTPWKRLTHSSGGTVTQYTSCSVYSSGTIIWANNSEIAMKGDIVTDTNTTYTLTKSGSTITLTGSDGSTNSVTDSDTDTKVTQTVTSSNASYPLLLAPNGQTATTTTTTYFDSGVTLNPNTNTIAGNVSGSSGSCTGNAATATTAEKVQNSLKINLSGAATVSYEYNGYSAKTIDINANTVLSNTGVTAGSYGPSANASPAHKGTFSVPYITVDAKGRVTTASTKTITLPSETSLSTGSSTATKTLSHSGTFTAITGLSVSGHKITPTTTTYTLPSDNNTDTKNTAGSTNTTSKMYLIGATSQAANPQTYSNSNLYYTADYGLVSNHLQSTGTLAVSGDSLLVGDVAITSELTVSGDTSIGGDLYLSNGDNIFSAIYPVGSIYMSTSSTNPSEYFGGTWVAWGSGRVPVGVNTSDSNFSSVEKTGGASSVTLTTDQIPSHTHTFTGSAVTSGTQSANHTHTSYYYAGNSRAASGSARDTCVSPNYTTSEKTKYSTTTSANSANHTHSVTAAGTISNTGSGGAHNNLQPYITCYMWKRTA